jgi:cystathionine gamma-lyase
VAHRNIYGPARNLLSSYLSRFGVETVFVEGNDAASFSAAMNEQTTLVYLESPSTFLFSAQDIRGIAAAARARGAATVIDNTWATPLYQKPLALGADLSVHSASKYLGGHSDIVAGAIAGKADLVESIVRAERDHLGACMDPHQAWLLTRGLRTLPLRMERHSENARIVAAFLEGHELVEKLFWPGAASYPDKALVEAQMTGYSSVMSFVPRFPLERVGVFLSALKVLEVGPSWGGFESLAVAPGIFMDPSAMAELGLPRNLIRIAVGLESASTITEDLGRALRAAFSASVGSSAKGMENA